MLFVRYSPTRRRVLFYIVLLFCFRSGGTFCYFEMKKKKMAISAILLRSPRVFERTNFFLLFFSPLCKTNRFVRRDGLIESILKTRCSSVIYYTRFTCVLHDVFFHNFTWEHRFLFRNKVFLKKKKKTNVLYFILNIFISET